MTVVAFRGLASAIRARRPPLLQVLQCANEEAARLRSRITGVVVCRTRKGRRPKVALAQLLEVDRSIYRAASGYRTMKRSDTSFSQRALQTVGRTKPCMPEDIAGQSVKNTNKGKSSPIATTLRGCTTVTKRSARIIGVHHNPR